MRSYDAILVPGGGVREGGRLPSWVMRRLDRARELAGDAYIVTLSAGTPHRPPPPGARGFPIFEAAAGARYLLDAGFPAERLLIESASWDTIGNAYFSRVVHAEPRGFRRLAVITSDFHLARTRAVFEWVYRLEPCPFGYELDFEGVVDPEMDRAVLAERTAREAASLAAIDRLKRRIADVAGFHHWLFTEHAAYQAAGEAFGAAAARDSSLESY